MIKKHPPSRSRTLAATLLAAMLAVAGTSSVYAATDLWVGNTDANFNTLSNWTGSVTPNGNTPTFGIAGSSGTTLNNDQTGSSFAGLTFNSGASAYTIGGNSFTLSGNITNSSSSTQTINNAITLSNDLAYTFNNAASGNTILGGGIGSSLAKGITFTGAGTTTLGGTNTFNMKSTNGSGTKFWAFAVTSSNLIVTGATTVDGTGSSTDYRGYLDVNGASNLTVQSGGSLAINTSTASGLSSGIGNNVAGTSTLTVDGGSFSLDGNGGFMLGNNRNTATGVLTINSGTATIIAGSTTATDIRSFIAMGRDAANGIINLNGGTLATGRNFVLDGSNGAGQTGLQGPGSATFNFNGGTLKALANQTDWLNSATINTDQKALTSVTTGSVASTIDANGFTVGINTAITGSGGFHIVDSSATTGLVNFGRSSYAYLGVTSVDSGTLNTNAASVAFSGNIAVAGGKLTLNGASAGSVSTTGFSMSSGTWTVSIGDTVSTSGNMSITGGTLDVAAFSGSEATYSSTGYTLFTSISGTGSVSGLSITGYDTTNYSASLSNAGVLTFSAIPEPSTYAALAGVLALGAVITRRRSR